MKYYKVLGTNVSAVNLESAASYFLKNADKRVNSYVCCANAHTTVFAFENLEYQKVLNKSFLTLPDGGPVAYEARKQKIDNVSKVSGVDFFEKILDLTKNTNIKHYFYGNKKEELLKFVDVIKEKYPCINICGYKESKFRDLTDDEKKQLRNDIIESEANLVWVALGAPKQEMFCSELCEGTNACFIAVGGAFKVIAGLIPRAPKWMQDNSLEWLYRFIKEPKRLFKRYFQGNIKYIYYTLINRRRNNENIDRT